MIIQSLLDTDLYKFTMMQAVLHHFPAAQAEYQFQCRTPNVDLRPYTHAINAAIEDLGQLRLTISELSYLESLNYFDADFLEYLYRFRPNPDHVLVRPGHQQLEITIRGSWVSTILFEVPILAIINETYFKQLCPRLDYSTALLRLTQKAQLIVAAGPNFSFSEFGTRRRFSKEWQEELLTGLKVLTPNQLNGTSNLDLARRLNLPSVGTMAHEFFQGCQALAPNLSQAQIFALDTWLKEYDGDLGIALSDTYGIDAFLADFGKELAARFSGVRHDSGDPFKWTERMLAHYRKSGIDPLKKTLVYSDSLTIPLALTIFDRYRDQARLSFGIGTNLTNDVGPDPLNIVIKMTRLNGQAVAKLSDTPTKTVCPDPDYLKNLRNIYQRKVAI